MCPSRLARRPCWANTRAFARAPAFRACPVCLARQGQRETANPAPGTSANTRRLRAFTRRRGASSSGGRGIPRPRRRQHDDHALAGTEPRGRGVSGPLDELLCPVQQSNNADQPIPAPHGEGVRPQVVAPQWVRRCWLGRTSADYAAKPRWPCGLLHVRGRGETTVDFEAQLKDWCATACGPYRRPFAPNPQWGTADVFIVGTNPATPLRNEYRSFDEYWDSLTRTPAVFERHYSAQHGGGTSKSTSWTKKLKELLQPLNCLVTNACWFPVQKQKEIPASEWAVSERGLSALVGFVRPKALFCHGAVAEAFAKSLWSAADRYCPLDDQNTVVNGTLILCYHHFSGQGLRKGTRFDPASELPRFAERIKRHAGAL